MKQVIVLLSMVIVGLVIFSAIYTLGNNVKSGVNAADSKVGGITQIVSDTSITNP